MPREKFVWEGHIRREALDDELTRLRELPYSLWREVIDSPMTEVISTRDGRNYRVRLEATLNRPGADDIRVTVTLVPAGWRHKRAASQSFVITPESRFIG